MRVAPASDSSIRPSLRVAGVFLMLLMSYFFIDSATLFFEAERIVPRACDRGKGWAMCEFINALWSFVPPSIHDEIEGTAGLAASGFAIYFAWLLLKPLLSEPRKAGRHDVA